MSVGERIRRYVVMFSGIFAISVGVALLTKSQTGTSAISVIPYTISLVLPQFSYGFYVAAFNALLVVFQIVLLKRGVSVFDICQQLVLCLFFGSFVDAAMWLLSWFNPQFYPARLATLIVGVIILGFGAYLTIISRVGTMAGDGFGRALSQVTGKEFGMCRVMSDSVMAIIAVVLNLVFFQSLVTVREGTLGSALGSGTVVGLCSRYLKPFEYFILPKNRLDDDFRRARKEVPQGNFIVTIAREYGSGGREIGRRIADELGIAFYSSEDIARRAMSEFDLDADSEKNVRSSAVERFYKLYAGGESVAQQDLPSIDRAFDAECAVMRDAASQGDCVIVGRLGNWVLKDHQNTFSVFVWAREDARVEHAVGRDGLTVSQARDKIARVDRERAEHCRYCTGAEWGDLHGYDMTVDSSQKGIAETGRMLAAAAKEARMLASA